MDICEAEDDTVPTCKNCKDYIIRPNIYLFYDNTFNESRTDL